MRPIPEPFSAFAARVDAREHVLAFKPTGLLKPWLGEIWLTERLSVVIEGLGE
jgi:hypothetical protein